MAKQMVIPIPLSSLSLGPGFTLVPGQKLPKGRSKHRTEMQLAGDLLNFLAEKQQACIENLQQGADPPDIAFSYNGQPQELELTEILPFEWIEREKAVEKQRAEAVARLILSERTQNWVVDVTLPTRSGSYSTDYLPGYIEKELAEILQNFFDTENDPVPPPNVYSKAHRLEVSPLVRKKIDSVSAYRWDLSSDGQLNHPHEPKINFYPLGFVPEDDFPNWTRYAIDKKEEGLLKRLKSISSAIILPPQWLLLWTEHEALNGWAEGIEAAIRGYLDIKETHFHRIFHWHLHERRVREFRNLRCTR